jgi:hypothetical protein
MIKARYHFNGRVSRPLTELKPGDVVHLPGQKPSKFTVTWVHTEDFPAETKYGTDCMGVVYARELERIGI